MADAKEVAADVEQRRIEIRDEVSWTRDQEAARLAYEAGVEKARLDARLDGHTEHLGRVNGSIEKFARAQERTAEAIRTLHEEIDSDLVVLRKEIKQSFDSLVSATKDAESEVAKAAAADRADRRKQLITLLTVTITTAGGIIGTLVATSPA